MPLDGSEALGIFGDLFYKSFFHDSYVLRGGLKFFIGLKAEDMADGVGFEPTRRLHACRFSRPVPSTARPPIHLTRITDNVEYECRQALFIERS